MRDLTRTESRVLAQLDTTRLVADLVELVRLPSITGTDAEADLQHRQSTQLSRYGFEVDAWKFDLAALEAETGYPGTEAARTEGHGVVGSLGGSGIPALVLQGHVDVVPTGDISKWDGGDPFQGAITGRTLHGRGACDMKGGVAANFAVARTLAASGITLERPFAIHSVISEEDGGLGAFGTLLRGHTADAAVITEPTSGRIVTANAGSLTFTIRVPGRAAHGSTRLEGHSAFEAFLPIFQAVQDLERRRNLDRDPLFDGNPLPYPISIGKIAAGDWASSVPDLLTAEGRLGVRLDEDLDTARHDFDSAIATAALRDPWLADNPPQVRWHGGTFASGRLNDHHDLIHEVAASVADVSDGELPSRAAAPYGSDRRLYDAMGIPALHYGPGDVRYAHAPREQVDLDEVIAVTSALIVLALRRCDAHF